MDDFISKGTGNSRFLRSVANIMTLYPTWEAAAQALAAGTFPVDFNGINPAGVEQMGTALSKVNLLTDATATGMGLTAAATPNQALEKLRQLIQTAQSTANGRVQIAIGSWVGTGQAGPNNPTTLSFPFPLKMLLIFEEGGTIYPAGTVQSRNAAIGLADSLTTSYVIDYKLHFLPISGQASFGSANYTYHLAAKKSADGKTVYFYSYTPLGANDANYQYNATGTTYRYLAIG